MAATLQRCQGTGLATKVVSAALSAPAAALLGCTATAQAVHTPSTSAAVHIAARSMASADAERRHSPHAKALPHTPGTPRVPWMPTCQLDKRKVLTKRMGYLIQELEKEQVQARRQEKGFPQFDVGDELQLEVAIPENQRRLATVRGLCIARYNKGWRTSFIIRNFLGSAGAVERTFQLYSPQLQSVTVLKSRKVRRAKLYYLRDRKPSEYRV